MNGRKRLGPQPAKPRSRNSQSFFITACPASSRGLLGKISSPDKPTRKISARERSYLPGLVVLIVIRLRPVHERLGEALRVLPSGVSIFGQSRSRSRSFCFTQRSGSNTTFTQSVSPSTTLSKTA